MRSVLRCAIAAAALCAPLAAPAAAAGAPPPERAAPGAPVIRQVLSYVDRLYVEPGLVDARAMLAGALRALEARYPEVIADVAAGSDAAAVRVDSAALRLDLAGAATLEGAAGLLEEVAAFAAPRLDPAPGDGPAYVALRGALESLDPHTALLSPGQHRDFTRDTRGVYGGIGISFTPSAEGIVVDEVRPGSPAEAGGILAGEVVTAVDGASAAGVGADGAAELVRGEVGSRIVLAVRPSGGGTTREVALTRALITERSVRSEVLEGGGARPLLHVTITRFQQETAAQLREALAGAAPDTAGVILDLRGNPGGVLDAAVSAADIFLDAGTIVSVRDRGGRARVFEATPFGIVDRRPPLVVLINRGSASAAEVLAAALKESRAVLVGETSYGKGSVQQVYPLDDGGALLLTVRHYYTPGDASIQARGVEPDVLLRPVVVGEKTIVGGPAPVHTREASLRNAFGARGTARDGAPSWKVPFLRGAPPAIGRRGDAGTGAPAADTALRTAAAVLRRAAADGGDGSRRALLAAAGRVAAEVAAEEEVLIRAALAGKGVDWTDGGAGRPRGAAPTLVAELPEELVLSPGATTRVTLRLRNAGGRTARRVWGRTSSENPFLANMDFVFGSVNPGETKEATVELSVPAWAWARWDHYELALQEGDGEVLGTFRGAARMLAGSRPALAYSLALADEGRTAGRAGDGILREGEHLRLRVRLAGAAGDAPGPVDLRISATPAGSVVLDRRTAALRGGEAEAFFDARVAEDAGDATLSFDLSFSGGALGAVVDDRIEVPVGRRLTSPRERRPPLVSALEAPPERTAGGAVRLRLAVTDETSVKDVRVVVGGRKVLYRRAGANAASLPLEVEVALAEGSNRIEVLARDGDGLTAVRTFFVYRTPG